jgi:hypothetical protein
MIDCQSFLERYSAYRDHDVSWAERDEMEAHADECPHCARYDRVVRRGAEVLRALGERLKWRLHQADFEARRERVAAPAQAVGTFAVAAMVAVAAWIPLMRPRPAVSSLPAVAASAPPAQGLLLRRFLASRERPEAMGLTSRLAEIGVRVRELPYHDVVFRPQGPLVGELASSVRLPAAAAVQP